MSVWEVNRRGGGGGAMEVWHAELGWTKAMLGWCCERARVYPIAVTAGRRHWCVHGHHSGAAP